VILVDAACSRDVGQLRPELSDVGALKTGKKSLPRRLFTAPKRSRCRPITRASYPA